MKTFTRRLIIVFTLIICVGNVFAQDYPQTLLRRGYNHNGFYGAPVVKYTQINGESALMIGGQVAWVIDRSLGLGFAGYGLAIDERRTDILPNENLHLAMGYGGLLVEPILFSNQLVHFELPVLVGAGYAQYFIEGRDYWNDWDETYGPGEAFFVFEPGANVVLNLSRHVRLGAGITYRVIEDINVLPNTSEADLEGMSYSLTVKIGRF